MNRLASDRTDTGKALFELGQTVATPGALEALEQSKQTPAEFLARHQKGDWRGLNTDDKWANEDAVRYEGDSKRQRRVLSAYRTNMDVKIWIITEADRSVTTILLPSEY